MDYLLVYAHPDTGGHCSHILGQLKERFRREDKNFEVLDLYKEKYDCVLHENEHYTRKKNHVSKRNKQIQKMIKSCRHIIFIYPIWWYGAPSILKGFFDKVFTPGFAFRFENGKIVKLLEGKRATVFFTTGGPKIFYFLTGNLPKKNIKWTLGFAGIRPNVIHFGSCLKFTQYNKDKISRKIMDLKPQTLN